MSKKNLDFQSDVQELAKQASEFQEAFTRVHGKTQAGNALRTDAETGEMTEADNLRNAPANAADSKPKNPPKKPFKIAEKGGRRFPDSAAQSNDELIVQFSTKITHALLDRLEKSYLERRSKKLFPWKKQEIVMEALTDWFEKHGH